MKQVCVKTDFKYVACKEIFEYMNFQSLVIINNSHYFKL